MKIIVIIQARMGSTRLPGKILLPLNPVDNLKYVTERCKRIIGIEEVIVATSTLPVDDKVEAWCRLHQVNFYRGSEEDVLDRFVQCAKPYNPDYVIRVTADCPYVDFEMASDMVAIALKTGVDLVDIPNNIPRGLIVEIISYKALLYIHQHGHEERHREHVTYYAKEYIDEFTRVPYIAPRDRQHPELRITLDTVEDYEVISGVANYFGQIEVPCSEVIRHLLEHPELAALNAHIEQKLVI